MSADVPAPAPARRAPHRLQQRSVHHRHVDASGSGRRRRPAPLGRPAGRRRGRYHGAGLLQPGVHPYWRTDRFPYDTRPQHRRFLPLLDAGVQPLQVLADRCHERGMTFLGGLRMNDTHDFPEVRGVRGVASRVPASQALGRAGHRAAAGSRDRPWRQAARLHLRAGARLPARRRRDPAGHRRRRRRGAGDARSRLLPGAGRPRPGAPDDRPDPAHPPDAGRARPRARPAAAAGGARAFHRGRVPGHGPGRAGLDRRGADRLLRADGHDVLRLQRGIRGVRRPGARAGQRVHAVSRAASLGQPPPAPQEAR